MYLERNIALTRHLNHEVELPEHELYPNPVGIRVDRDAAPHDDPHDVPSYKVVDTAVTALLRGRRATRTVVHVDKPRTIVVGGPVCSNHASGVGVYVSVSG